MGTSVKQTVEMLLRPLEAEGYEIWNVEYVQEGKEKQLRVFVDKEGGIGIDGCEAVSRYLSDRLDRDDPIGEAYSLVVSSPGMDRQLLRDGHFSRYAGSAVEVSLYKALEGRKKFAALLGTKTPEYLYVTPIDPVTLAPTGGEIAIPAELVCKVSLMVIF
ncbi:MAG: ribosome maturation factor RimP [Clostridiales Family XIII bacterium]|jgi:ribosome maturation factor RimP|nr:ribosome maturation factor RimP [Clostridiales Family XIII bacterium]